MIRMFNNLRTGHKLSVLILAPLAAFLYLAITDIHDKRQVSSEMARLKSLMTAVTTISDLAHSLQKERGLSSSHVGAEDDKFLPGLKEQYRTTDLLRGEIKTDIGSWGRDDAGRQLALMMEPALEALLKASNERSAVGRRDTTVEQVLAYYSEIVDSLLAATASAPRWVHDQGLANILVAYVHLLYEIEFAGRERAVLAYAFAHDEFKPGMYIEYERIKAAQDVHADVFNAFAPEAIQAEYMNTIAGAVVAAADEFRRVAEAGAATGGFDADPKAWFRVQSEKIELMQKVETRLARLAGDHAGALAHAADRKATFELVEGLLILLVTLALAYLVATAITLPLRGLTKLATQVAAGDLTAEAARSERSDEVGELTNAFAGMVDNMRDLNRELQDGIGVIASSSSEILGTVTQVTAAATETSTAVAETATTIEEVKQTTEVASEKAATIAERARDAVTVAEKGEQQVATVADGMTHIHEQMGFIADSIIRLSEQSQTIGEIVSSVSDLAEQSNVLAVNASIEAARAGEQGKGFAVVAQEVKSLADQSKEATSRVRALLAEIQKATSEAVMATEQGSKVVEKGLDESKGAGDAIRVLAEQVSESARAFSQMAASAQQQLAGVSQVTAAIDDINRASAQNVSSIEQVSAAAENLGDLGAKLKALIGRYKL